MKPEGKERLEVLKIEMGLLQGTLDKYDSLIFQSRNWFISLWLGAVGLAFTAKVPNLALLAGAAAVIYWVFEGLMRHQYWYKYVVRYRAIRQWLNAPGSPEAISIYDLTNHYGERAAGWLRFRKCFFKLEPTIVYSLISFAAWVVSYLVPAASQL